MYDYNTTQEHLILKEYGRNIQQLVKYLFTIEDREERSKKAATLIELMKQINPELKDAPEVAQKLWDDIHIIAGFGLEIDGPFPAPSKEILNKKPNRVPYTSNEITFKHFGRNIELLVEKAITLEDKEEQEAAIIHIGKLMKTFFSSYNKDTMDDKVVYNNIRLLSKNQLDIDMDKVKEGNLFEPQRRDRKNDRNDRPERGERGERNERSGNSNNNNNRRPNNASSTSNMGGNTNKRRPNNNLNRKKF